MTRTPTAPSAHVWSWLFHHGLNELKRAYEAAREASKRERELIERQWKELEAEIAQGRASLTEEGEDGQVLYDRGEHVGEMLYEVESVLDIVREAFTISLHHFWERQVTHFMRSSRYSQREAFDFLKGAGISPDEPTLNALRLTANVAKHSQGTSADELHGLRPEMFDAAEMTKWGNHASREHLIITDQTLEAFFEGVRQSGPKRHLS